MELRKIIEFSERCILASLPPNIQPLHPHVSDQMCLRWMQREYLSPGNYNVIAQLLIFFINLNLLLLKCDIVNINIVIQQ